MLATETNKFRKIPLKVKNKEQFLESAAAAFDVWHRPCHYSSLIYCHQTPPLTHCDFTSFFVMMGNLWVQTPPSFAPINHCVCVVFCVAPAPSNFVSLIFFVLSVHIYIKHMFPKK